MTDNTTSDPGPLATAVSEAAHNTALITATADKDNAQVTGSIERDFKDGASVGVAGSAGTKSGWSVSAFFKKIWGG